MSGTDEPIKIPVRQIRSPFGGTTAGVTYAILAFNVYLGTLYPVMSVVSGLVALGMFGLLHFLSNVSTSVVNGLLVTQAIDSIMKIIENKDGTLLDESGLNNPQGEDNESDQQD